MDQAADRWSLTVVGDVEVELVVETWVEGKHNHARLLIDGEEADTGRTDEIGRIDLGRGTPHHTRARFIWTGRTTKVGLVERTLGRETLTQFRPPEGHRAGRTYALQQQHPTLYAARHVAINVAGTALAILGVGALLRLLVPRIDLGWLPDWDLRPPEWLRYLDPARYLEPVLTWLGSWLPDLPELPDLPGWAKYVFGFLVAVAVAVQEARRAKRRKEAAVERDGESDPQRDER